MRRVQEADGWCPVCTFTKPCRGSYWLRSSPRLKIDLVLVVCYEVDLVLVLYYEVGPMTT